MRGLERFVGLLGLALAAALWLAWWVQIMKERRDRAWQKAASAWLDAKMLMDEAKAKIRKLAGEESCYGGGVKHLWNIKSGNVEYAKIPELVGVNLEAYRRPGHFESRISAL